MDNNCFFSHFQLYCCLLAYQTCQLESCTLPLKVRVVLSLFPVWVEIRVLPLKQMNKAV